MKSVAACRESVVCISAKTGDGVDDLMNTIERSLRLSMELVQALIPFSKVTFSRLWKNLSAPHVAGPAVTC